MKTLCKYIWAVLVGFVVGQYGGLNTIASESVSEIARAADAAELEVAASALPDHAQKTLRFNFRGVPLETVLLYLSQKAGFIIIPEVDVNGRIDAWSNQPLSKDEAVDLINTILRKNGLAAIRNDRTLSIVTLETARSRDLPVKRGGDAEAIPQTDEIVTQIVPVRHANVVQLQNDLRPLLADYATLTANESANSLVLTAAQTDIHRMVEIINALDDNISNTTSIKVLPIRHADAKELASVIKELFQPAQSQSAGRGQAILPFGPGGAGTTGATGVGGRGGRNTAGTGATSSAVAAPVVAVADERSNTLVVSAPADLLIMIQQVVEEIDLPVNDITELRVFHLRNADPTETADLLANLFPEETGAASSDNQQSFRVGAGGFGGGTNTGRSESANVSAGPSERMKKKGRVVAVTDARTSSVIVSAASEWMPQIESLIASLDSNPARKQKVFVYEIKNGNAQNLAALLVDLFQSQSGRTSQTGTTQSDPLQNRMNQSQQTSGATGFGGGNNRKGVSPDN